MTESGLLRGNLESEKIENDDFALWSNSIADAIITFTGLLNPAGGIGFGSTV